MGVYYIVVCEKRKEYIDPAWIASDGNPIGFAIKLGPTVLGPLMHIVAAWATEGKWSGESFAIMPDSNPAHDSVIERYENVSVKAIEHFVKHWSDLLGAEPSLLRGVRALTKEEYGEE